MGIALLVVSAAALVSSYDDGGLFLDAGEVAYVCTAGTDVGAKIADAMVKCSQSSEAATTASGRSLERKRKGKGKGKGKGEGKKCPTIDKIYAEMLEEFGEDKLCVYYQLGWVDNEGNVNNDNIIMDVMSLPQEVSDLITPDGVAECAQNMLSEMVAENPMISICADTYTVTEQDLLGEVALKVAGFKCFEDIFNSACNDYLRNEIFSYASSLTTQPAGRLLRLSCLSTCRAANFSSSTSCTFGLLFKHTQTCDKLFPGAAAANGLVSG